MFKTSQIKERMDVIGADGAHVGTVSRLVGDRLSLALTGTGPVSPTNRQRFLNTGMIRVVEGNEVRLSANGDVAVQYDDITNPAPVVAGAPVITSAASLPGTRTGPPAPVAGTRTNQPAQVAAKVAGNGAPAATDAPLWNWNGVTAAAFGAVAAARSAATGLLDDFGHRLETDEKLPLIGTDKIEGMAVIGRNGDTLGHIRRLLIDKKTGRVGFAVMTFGGKLGFGDALFALPFPMLAYDAARDGYTLDVTKAQLEKAPRLDADGTTEFTPAFRRKLILFYRS